MIGAGSVGEVYIADDSGLKRHVPLKVLPPPTARAASSAWPKPRLPQVSRPPTIYGLADEGDMHAIAVEFVDCPSLTCPQSLVTAIEYARQVNEALEYTNGRGVMHRHLKPANIKITADGRSKLLDVATPRLSKPEVRYRVAIGRKKLKIQLQCELDLAAFVDRVGNFSKRGEGQL
jgi:serine/threonine-protein kinase